MTIAHLLLLAAAAFLAGALNSVAGGGSFLSFPALVYTGVPSVMANATNTVALFPGQLASAWAYRRDFPRLPGLHPLVLIVVSLAGGVAGALLLVLTPQKSFDAVVPWLLLLATLLFAFSKRLVPWLQSRIHVGPGAVCALQFLLGVYGGYFGGAVGIMMLAVFGLFGIDDIHAANALKTLLGGLINAIAVVCFIAAGKVEALPAVIMLTASVLGGYAGARGAKAVPQTLLRRGVVAAGTVMTLVFFIR